MLLHHTPWNPIHTWSHCSLAKNKNELTCHISAMTDEPTPGSCCLPLYLVVEYSWFNKLGSIRVHAPCHINGGGLIPRHGAQEEPT